jgi:hypothetical protein
VQGDAIISGDTTITAGNIIAYGVGGGTYDNNFIGGKGAGAALTNAEYNVIIGADAADLFTGSSENVVIGMEAANGADFNDCVAVGHQAMKGASALYRTTSIGPRSGVNSTGKDCLYLGHSAGDSNTTDDKLFISGMTHDLVEGYFNSSTGWLTVHGDLNVDGDSTVGGAEILAISSEVQGTYNAMDVAGKRVIKVATASGNTTINGFTGGITGQMISLIKPDFSFDMIFNHENASGTEEIRTHTGIPYNLTDHGAVELIYDGTYWYIIK